MEFLILLVEERGKLVSRDQIVSRLWPDPHTLDVIQGINNAASRIRAVLNDNAAEPRFIETVVGKGYRFVAAVEEIEAAITAPVQPQAELKQLIGSSATVAIVHTATSLETVRPTLKMSARSGRWVGACLILTVCLATWYWKSRHAAFEPIFRQITTLVPENRATAAAISPDGKSMTYANVDGIFVRREHGETTKLAAPPDFIVDRLAWFADGTKLVTSGFSSLNNVPGVWTIPLTGAARQLRAGVREGTPSPDGMRIAVISQNGSEIWTVGASGEEPQRIVAGSAKDNFEFVFWSPDGRRLSFERHAYTETSDYRSYESVVLATATIVTKAPNLWMSSAASLVDGRILFLRWDNDDFTSSHEVWEVKTDLETGGVAGKPHKVTMLPGDSTTLLDLSVTADGKRAMVLRRFEQNSVFVGNFDQAAERITDVRRLTLDERINYPHAWTADNRAVIFESNRNGNFDLFKQDIDQRTAETVVATPATEILPQLAPGGHFILYAVRAHEDKRPWYYKASTYKLMRVPVDGGTPEEVPIGGLLDEFRCALGGKRCVLRTTQPGEYRTYYDLDPVRGKGRELARSKWTSEVLGDWDVSPNGAYVAIPNHDSHDARIRVIALEPKAGEPRESEVALAGMTNLRGLVWAANGHSWFVSVDTTVGNQMLYVHSDGRFQSLGDIQGWAVPSPDGRSLAFLNRIIATNAWAFELR